MIFLFTLTTLLLAELWKRVSDCMFVQRCALFAKQFARHGSERLLTIKGPLDLTWMWVTQANKEVETQCDCDYSH